MQKEASHAKIAWMLAALNWSPLTLRPSKRSVISYWEVTPDKDTAFPLHILLFQHPPQRSLVVCEQLPNTFVAHLVVVELFLEELVLLANLGFVAHTKTLSAGTL